jgi:hypothetical protein
VIELENTKSPILNLVIAARTRVVETSWVVLYKIAEKGVVDRVGERSLLNYHRRLNTKPRVDVARLQSIRLLKTILWQLEPRGPASRLYLQIREQ